MVYRDDKKVPDDKEEDDGSKSGLMDKSLFPEGTKVGDKVLVKITHAFDQEFEFKYAHADKGKSEDKGEESQEEAPDADLEDLVADA